DRAPQRHMLFRIGLHVGDVMAKDGDLFGDAVNIAARLQSLAEPGGICVSAALREHAGSRVAAEFTDLGPLPVKNIAAPVHVLRVHHASTTLTHSVAGAPGSPLSRNAGEGAERQRREAGEGRPAALALPDKPSMAVRPFANISSDP